MSEKEILEEKSKIVCYLVDVFGGTDSDIIDRVPNYIIDKIVDDYFENDEEIRKLKQQLAEKDKEIEKLKEIKAIKNEKTLKTEIDGVEFTTEQIMVLQRIGISLENHDKQIRHQICERIRDFAEQTYYEFGVFDETDLVHILDRIEEGE